MKTVDEDSKNTKERVSFQGNPSNISRGSFPFLPFRSSLPFPHSTQNWAFPFPCMFAPLLVILNTNAFLPHAPWRPLVFGIVEYVLRAARVGTLDRRQVLIQVLVEVHQRACGRWLARRRQHLRDLIGTFLGDRCTALRRCLCGSRLGRFVIAEIDKVAALCCRGCGGGDGGGTSPGTGTGGVGWGCAERLAGRNRGYYAVALRRLAGQHGVYGEDLVLLSFHGFAITVNC